MVRDPVYHCAICGVVADPGDGARRLRVGAKSVVFCGDHAETIRGLTQTAAARAAQSGMQALKRKHPFFGAFANALGQAVAPGLLGGDHE